MSPADERPVITDELVAALVADQFPDLAGEEIGRHYTLSDHTTVRIGDAYGVLMPTLPHLDEYYARSATLIRPFVDGWTFPHAAPERTGVPGHGYPYHFELCRWTTASNAALVPLDPSEAPRLGDALRQVHRRARAKVGNRTTSRPMADFQTTLEGRIAQVRADGGPDGRTLNLPHLLRVWEAGRDAEIDAGPTWTHGSLAPRNVLSDQGEFAGIIGWRFFAAGDPAADIAPTLMLFPRETHGDLLAAYGKVSTTTRLRMAAGLVLSCLWHLTDDDPFTVRMAWERLAELDMVREA